MVKYINKLLFWLKNILLPIVLIATIYIIVFMFKRLEKEIFGANMGEFLGVVTPFILVEVLSVINIVFNQKNVNDCFFYNAVSFFVTLTIAYFCYRAFFDQNMFLWHKYSYQINFNYFSDQIAPSKVMLYVLAFADVLLVIEGYLKNDKVTSSLKEEIPYEANEKMTTEVKKETKINNNINTPKKRKNPNNSNNNKNNRNKNNNNNNRNNKKTVNNLDDELAELEKSLENYE